MRQQALEAVLGEDSLARAGTLFEALEAEARHDIEPSGFRIEAARARRSLMVRYQGTDTPIEVPQGDAEAVRTAFEAAYEQRFTFTSPEVPLVIEAVSLELVIPPERARAGTSAAPTA